ncbi:MAG: FlgD immunoglobulin-like domain containing protein, partial [Candidatus Poribacteria bacterium]
YASTVVQFDARPRATALLPNYPNPFNPETWIPFTLTSASHATIRIYDVQGAVVRSLHLGSRPAGHHISRADAAHWDGRNAVGEAASSGVYFYELDAGGERSIRQMVIRK